MKPTIDYTNMNSMYNVMNKHLNELDDIYTIVFNETSQSGEYLVSWIYANTTTGTLNATYFDDLGFNVTGDAPADSCTCAGADTNWEIDLSDYCVIQSLCNLTTGNITFINTGNITFDAIIQATHINDLPANEKGYLGSSADIRIKE